MFGYTYHFTKCNTSTLTQIKRSFLSSLFPIPITWNFACAPKTRPVELPDLGSSIAMRLAYSVFQAHKITNTTLEERRKSFSNFEIMWDKALNKPDELVNTVLQRIQDWLPKGRNILIIVDEASKTDHRPSQSSARHIVRDVDHNACRFALDHVISTSGGNWSHCIWACRALQRGNWSS